MLGLWCTEVKLWFGLRPGVARPCIVWAHEGHHCRRAPCQHMLGRAVIWPSPEWALCFCVPWLCLGLSLISAPYLFSRSRVTCLRSWSPFFHTTNALWQQQPPPSKAFSSPRECLISQVCLQIKSSFCLSPSSLLAMSFPLHFKLLWLWFLVLKLWHFHSIATKKCLIHTWGHWHAPFELGLETKAWEHCIPCGTIDMDREAEECKHVFMMKVSFK